MYTTGGATGQASATENTDGDADGDGELTQFARDLEATLLVFARFLHGHVRNQSDLLRLGVVAILERGLITAAEKGMLLGCGRKLTHALLELGSSCAGNDVLEYQVQTGLLFNLHIW